MTRIEAMQRAREMGAVYYSVFGTRTKDSFRGFPAFESFSITFLTDESSCGMLKEIAHYSIGMEHFSALERWNGVDIVPSQGNSYSISGLLRL